MNAGKALVNIIIVFLLLLIFSLVGAITIPSLPGANSSVDTYVVGFLLILLPVIVLSIIAFFLGNGVRSLGPKFRFQALGLTYASALIIGGVLALFTLFNFPYSAHVNFTWLGHAWYSPWLTLFLIGAPIIMAFIV